MIDACGDAAGVLVPVMALLLSAVAVPEGVRRPRRAVVAFWQMSARVSGEKARGEGVAGLMACAFHKNRLFFAFFRFLVGYVLH